jgi:peptidoglycan/LPS O-acetylase OafA/YrhL
VGAARLPYRPDVDGLRALAITAVVLFHAGFSAVPGGFVGVDVFFVISGFLITGLITDRLRHREFSFWEFYARRVRRIFPALFAMLTAVLLAGYFILTPDEYQALGESAAYSSTFMANVYFWLHTGYFDQSADSMPLLHLWSIGVEEQFYLIWPLSLVLVWRYVRLGPSASLVALTLVTVVLALLSVVWTSYDAKSAFYLPFTRLWEFTLGAMLLALPIIRQPRLADTLSVLGVLAIVFAALAFNSDLNYPGYYALLPCVGTAAVIVAGERSFVSRILSLGPSVLLGKISYSLYLWHWPIIVFYVYYAGTDLLSTSEKFSPILLSTSEKFSLILSALAISFVSWRFVELPIRRQRGHARLYIALGTSVAAGAACVALVVAATAGFASRLPKELRSLASHDEMARLSCVQRIRIQGLRKVCVVGAPLGSGTGIAVLWGDSHAFHLGSLLDLSAKKYGLSMIVWRGCPPFVDDVMLRQRERGVRENFTSKCGKTRKQILSYIRANPEVKLIIISNAWPTYPGQVYSPDSSSQEMSKQDSLRLIEKGFSTTMTEIKQLHRPVLLMGDVPRANFSVPNCVMQAALKLWRKPCGEDMNFLDREEVFKLHRPTESILANLASDEYHVYYVDVQKLLCGPQGCPLTINGETIYADGNHLRRDLTLDTRRKLVSLLRLDDAIGLALGPQDAAHASGSQNPAHAEAR